LARAKRTDRTEARRRTRVAQLAAYRAANPAPEPDGEDDDEDEPTPEPTRRRGTRPASATPSSQRFAPAPRPGITSSLRAAYRPVQLREDLATLPQLLMQPGVIGTAVATVLVAAYFAIAYAPAVGAVAPGDSAGLVNVVGTNQTPYLLFNLLLGTPPAPGAFLIGYFAKRSAWLGGLLFGMVAAACFTVLVLTPSGRLLTGDNDKLIYVVQAWIFDPLGAMLFAAAAAWYRRFLRIATPPRQAPPSRGGSAKTVKPVQGRGDAPRNRLSGGGR
jgi:hypothetical protein